MTLRHLSTGLVLLAVLCSTGCSSCRLFDRSSACAPRPAVAAPGCCPEPVPMAAPVGGPPAVQSYSIQAPCCNGIP
jgi:hypothetical protein